jgi:hypothetical protein
MKRNILFLIIFAILASCGTDNFHNSSENIANLNSLTGLNWYERVLETDSLIEINIKNPISEDFTKYLESIDSNFSMAYEGELWQVGCSPPMIFDSASIVKHRDEKSGEIWSTTGYLEVDAPLRKLVYFGQNKKMAVLTYMTGGFAVMQHIVLFKIEKGKIIKHWHGNTIGDISSEKEILKRIKYKELEEITIYI